MEPLRLRDEINARYNVYTTRHLTPDTAMPEVRKWLEKHHIEPTENDEIDVYLDDDTITPEKQ